MPEPAIQNLFFPFAIAVFTVSVYLLSVFCFMDALFGMGMFFRGPQEMIIQGAAMQGPDEHPGSGDNILWG
jgi:hypothetical protein